jgi:hypothetical protein
MYPSESQLHLADAQRSSGGFGGYHMAVLALAARFFDSQTWADISVPSEEAAQGKYISNCR